MSLFSKFRNNIAKTWDVIKNNLNSKKRNEFPDYLVHNNIILNEKKEIANAFNNLFINIPDALLSNINIRHNENIYSYIDNLPIN